jgi:hypothetical protein
VSSSESPSVVDDAVERRSAGRERKVEEQRRLGCVAIGAVVALEHAERHDVEEVPPAARVELEPSPGRGPSPRTVKTPSSTALSSVFDPQKPSPSCMIASGVDCAGLAV